MRPARSNATRKIARRRFRRPPRPVADLLRSLAEYQPVSSWPRDHRALADQVADAEPFTILLCAEPLAREHWRRRTHTTMQRVELVSALDETVFRHFERQLSARMAEWLRHHPDPEDAHLRALVREYYPQARTILRAELREAFPRAWRRQWAARAWSKPRLRIECRRRYDLPAPLGLWTTDVPQQFYFMRRTRTFDRGCSSSSGAREVHSYFGLAFLELTRRGTGIPCYILVYDRHNQLLLADRLPFFVLHQGAMGSNCAEPRATVRALMRSACTVEVTGEPDGTGIHEVRVIAPAAGLSRGGSP